MSRNLKDEEKAPMWLIVKRILGKTLRESGKARSPMCWSVRRSLQTLVSSFSKWVRVGHLFYFDIQQILYECISGYGENHIEMDNWYTVDSVLLLILIQWEMTEGFDLFLQQLCWSGWCLAQYFMIKVTIMEIANITYLACV